ncbi:MAG TPA: adenylate/guanylate cyclase domain-containing protein [Gemmatimonadota bacterium]|nr:adenylate/guanylate cyclase domain-containing protein [Gemmatimonadota bacterium]
MSTLHRHLAAVWFADIAGYTSLSEQNEGEAVRLAHAFQRAARAVADRFGGRIVKAMGDGALAEFSSTEMAARSAYALHRAFAEAAAEAGLSAGGLRVGVHVGDVAATDDGDLYGDGVNVASRLQSAAVPGEVWVSEDVWRQLRRRPELQFDPRGEHELKGIGQPMQAHALSVLDEEGWTPPEPSVVRATAAPEPARFAALRKRPLAAGAAVLGLLIAGVVAGLFLRDRGAFVPADALAENAAPGLAVVPFSVNDPELERWEEGLVDLLSTNLDGAGGLRAIDSRTVLARWRELVPEDGVADLPTALEVARRAGGKYGLVGSAVSSGASMRLVTDVYDLESGDALGQSQVEGSPDSIFALVDRLSIEVLALILEEESGTAPRLDLASVTTSSLPALKSFLEGEELARRGDFNRAIPAYEQALEADSTFALAHLRLGDAHGWTEGVVPVVRQQYAAAKRFAERLPPREADLLDVALAYANEHADATRLAREASQRYPDDPGAWYLLGEAYFHMPQQSLATTETKREPFTRALTLDPTYLPAEIHLVDLAFIAADEAAADSLVPHFREVARGSAYESAYSVGYALAFGDSETKSRALAGLDTLSFDVLRHMPQLLSHPRFGEESKAVVAATRAKPEYASVAPFVDFLYGQSLLRWGDLDTLVGLIERGEMAPPAVASTLGTAFFAGIPLPDGLGDDLFPADPADTPPGPLMAAHAFYALENGDRAAAMQLLGTMREGRQAILAAGDSASAREIEEIVQVLEARDAMLRGSANALELVEAAYRSSGIPPAAIWAAQILDRAGETERAIEYYEVLGATPMTGIELGALYEKAGRREDAIEAYGWVLLAWEGADPALRPRVAEARQAIARLEGLRRT